MDFRPTCSAVILTGGLNRRMQGRHGLWRQWLHAFSIELRHPVDERDLEVRAPVPEDLLRVLSGEGFSPLSFSAWSP